MDKNIIKRLKAQISLYKRKGWLPHDRDVVKASNPKRHDYGSGMSVVGGKHRGSLNPAVQLAERQPYTSREAQILAERKDEFEGSLSHQEHKVYSMVILGGMGKKEVGDIIGVSAPRVTSLLHGIRLKAKKVIARG